MFATGWNVSPSRTSAGSSSTSRALALGINDVADASRCAATAFSRKPPMRQHAAAQRDFARHRHVATDGDARQRADDRGRDRDAGRRSVLRRRAGRNVHVQVARPRNSGSMPSVRARAAHVAQRGAGRLLHHVAEGAGQVQPPAAGTALTSISSISPTHARVGEPRRDADLVVEGRAHRRSYGARPSRSRRSGVRVDLRGDARSALMSSRRLSALARELARQARRRAARAHARPLRACTACTIAGTTSGSNVTDVGRRRRRARSWRGTRYCRAIACFS